MVVVLAAAAILYFSPTAETPEPQRPLASAPAAKPSVRYPVETVTPPGPLPELRESDGALVDALAELFGRDLENFFYLTDIIHRVVATIDNLPREHVSLRLMPVKPLAGGFLTTRRGEGLAISVENATRYRPYVRLMEAMPTEALIAVYKRFYPLFQKQYETLGYPGRYFNDRLVEAIDHMLEVPELRRPVLLSQPKVLYEFADPKLERLSAGQKMLLRMGPENVRKVKMKLREIRKTLVS